MSVQGICKENWTCDPAPSAGVSTMRRSKASCVALAAAMMAIAIGLFLRSESWPRHFNLHEIIPERVSALITPPTTN
jgi:hypothetical protein